MDCTLRETGRLGERAQACRDRAPSFAHALAVEMQVNQIGGGSLIVADQIAHEHVDHIIVDRNRFFEPRHDVDLAAIPINGQHFVRPKQPQIWTRPERTNYVCSIMIKQIKFVSIPVADQNRALDFYTDKLGFTIITDQPFDEKQRWIELRIPKAETRVVLFTPEGDQKRIGSFMNMSFACEDIEQTYKDLTKRGVEFESAPQREPWGTYAMFKDSEGNRFVVSS